MQKKAQQPLLLISEGDLGILMLESHQDTWLVHTPSGCKNKPWDFYSQTIQPILLSLVWDFELGEVGVSGNLPADGL